MPSTKKYWRPFSGTHASKTPTWPGNWVNPEKLGLTVQAMVSVSLGRHSTNTIRPFEQAVKSIPHILVCYHVTGRFDYILHVVAKNLNHLGLLVKEQIASIAGVDKTETFLVFSEIKNNGGYPLDETEET